MSNAEIARIHANVTAAMPAITAAVEACERLVQVLDIPLPDMYGRSRALRRETAAVEAAIRELEPHEQHLPYYYAEIPNDARIVLRDVPACYYEGRRGSGSDLRAQATVRRMRQLHRQLEMAREQS